MAEPPEPPATVPEMLIWTRFVRRAGAVGVALAVLAAPPAAAQEGDGIYTPAPPEQQNRSEQAARYVDQLRAAQAGSGRRDRRPPLTAEQIERGVVLGEDGRLLDDGAAGAAGRPTGGQTPSERAGVDAGGSGGDGPGSGALWLSLAVAMAGAAAAAVVLSARQRAQGR